MLIDDSSHETAEEGENYFVSMTDMMVGVLFIFIIMLMVFALSYRKNVDTQEEAIKAAQDVSRQLDDVQRKVESEIVALDKAQHVRQVMLEEIQARLKQLGLEVLVDEKSGVLRLTEDAVRFDTGSAALLGPSQVNVQRIAQVLNDVMPRYACDVGKAGDACLEEHDALIETVFIEGHTDTRGGDGSNWSLSTSRAVNTYAEMTRLFPSLRKLRNSTGNEIISVSGYSSTRPLNPGENVTAWAQNRRIDLRFVMESGQRQRFEEILRLTEEMKRQIEKLRKSVGAEVSE